MNNLSKLYKDKSELLEKLEIATNDDIRLNISFKDKNDKFRYDIFSSGGWKNISLDESILYEVKKILIGQINKQLIEITEQIKQTENGNN